jgi:hypothetical protein
MTAADGGSTARRYRALRTPLLPQGFGVCLSSVAFRVHPGSLALGCCRSERLQRRNLPSTPPLGTCFQPGTRQPACERGIPSCCSLAPLLFLYCSSIAPLLLVLSPAAAGLPPRRASRPSAPPRRRGCDRRPELRGYSNPSPFLPPQPRPVPSHCHHGAVTAGRKGVRRSGPSTKLPDAPLFATSRS